MDILWGLKNMPDVESQLHSDLTDIIGKLRLIDGFDEATFQQLAQETSDEVALQILARFSRTLDESIAVLDEGLKTDSSDKVWRACHKIAGTAELVGFKSFGVLSRKLNRDLQAVTEIGAYRTDLNNYLQEAQRLLAQIQANFVRLNDYL